MVKHRSIRRCLTTVHNTGLSAELGLPSTTTDNIMLTQELIQYMYCYNIHALHVLSSIARCYAVAKVYTVQSPL